MSQIRKPLSPQCENCVRNYLSFDEVINLIYKKPFPQNSQINKHHIIEYVLKERKAQAYQQKMAEQWVKRLKPIVDDEVAA